jgi:glutamate racemase
LREALPKHDMVYLADNGHAPYGERSKDFIVARSQAVTAWLVSQHIELLVVACNTATAAAISELRASYPDIPIVGVEPALKPAVGLSQTGHIGVMATRSTLASGKFQALVAAQAGAATFIIQSCDGLASAIEAGAASGDSAPTALLCAQHIDAMGGPSRFGSSAGQMDTLVLGCTHYPFASDTIQALVGPNVRLVDNGTAVARQTQRLLPVGPATQSHEVGRLRLLCTGQPFPLKAGASRWLGLEDAASSVELLSI